VKTSSRTTGSGVVRYLQLARNEWDSGTQRSRTRVLYNFGREDELDREAIQRLVTSLSRLLEPGAALRATAGPGGSSSPRCRSAGRTCWTGLWRRLGIDAVIRGWVAGRRLDGPALERILFALVASRALAPSGKLAAAGWAGADVHIDGLATVSDDA